MPKLDALAAVIHSTPSKRYLNYLRSPEWQCQRREALRVAGYVCEICDTRAATRVHHWSYARLGNEARSDLCAICPQCHWQLHRMIGPPPPANDNEPQGELFKTA